MDASHVQDLFLRRLGIRIGPEMAGYVLRRLRAGEQSAVPIGPVAVMGGDARTGVPVRQFVDPSLLVGLPPSPPPA